MEKFNGLEFETVLHSDVAHMTRIMKRAFDEDSKIHLGTVDGGPPGYDNGEFIEKWYIQSGSEAFKVIENGLLIGGVNVFINEDQVNFLGNMFLEPSVQNTGYGKTIWDFIEHRYPQTKKWVTETPGFSRRNHHFYVNKCGFKIVKIEHPKDQNESSYILEKEMNLS